MKDRVTRSVFSIALVLGLAAMSIGVRVYAQANTAVRIDTLAIVGSTLTITGKNFGSSTPTVQVGNTTAAVSSSNDVEIVAEVAALANGTHLVTVVRDSNEGGSAMSTLRIQ